MRAANIETFVNYLRLPVMHGLTAGELAELLNTERNIHAKLRVIPMEGFTREMQFADTGLRWYAPWRGQLCSGVLLQLTDRRAFRPIQTGLSIASEILRQAPGKFHAQEIGRLVAEPNVVRALAQGTSPAELERLWELDLQRFEAVRRRYLRYPYCE